MIIHKLQNTLLKIVNIVYRSQISQNVRNLRPNKIKFDKKSNSEALRFHIVNRADSYTTLLVLFRTLLYKGQCRLMKHKQTIMTKQRHVLI